MYKFFLCRLTMLRVTHLVILLISTPQMKVKRGIIHGDLRVRILSASRWKKIKRRKFLEKGDVPSKT